jgi:putative two-component system response regulator
MDTGFNVLIVDDVVENIQVAMNVLKEENYSLTFALHGEEALDIIKENVFDLILLDIMMPGIDGFEVCSRLKENPTTKDIPIIFLTAKTNIESISEAFEIGAVDYLTKPFNPDELIARVRNHLELYRAKQILAQNNLTLKIKAKNEKQRLLTELESTQKEIIYILAELTETVSDETGKHIKRVADISRLLAYYHPALSEDDVTTIHCSAPMHDIGKVAVDQNILHKPSGLTESEFEVMKTHTTLAHHFLKNSQRKIIKAADIIAMQHHEKWDGSGYPKGLKGEDIHIYGRIVAVADVFDALTHKRVYKDSWSAIDATAYIQNSAGTHFDPHLVDIFMSHVEEFIALIDVQ